MQRAFDCVLLIAYGGPESLEQVRPFIGNVLRGKRVPQERIEEVVAHYQLIGGKSPLNDLTRDTAEKLSAGLAAAGHPLPVYIGMRNWDPFLADTLGAMAQAGHRRAVGIICSAQQCDSSWQQYQRDVAGARERVGPQAPEVQYVDGWHDDPLVIQAATDHAREALSELPAELRDGALLIFTAHSIPTDMAGADTYVQQIRTQAKLVADQLGQAEWQIAYQSRSGRPSDPWLEPDICEVLSQLAGSDTRSAVIAPIGFVGDHTEVLYDLDIEARQAADQAGLTVARARTVGTHPAYIRMLVERVVQLCSHNQ